jgi:hypothetical protein
MNTQVIIPLSSNHLENDYLVHVKIPKGPTPLQFNYKFQDINLKYIIINFTHLQFNYKFQNINFKYIIINFKILI